MANSARYTPTTAVALISVSCKTKARHKRRFIRGLRLRLIAQSEPDVVHGVNKREIKRLVDRFA